MNKTEVQYQRFILGEGGNNENGQNTSVLNGHKQFPQVNLETDCDVKVTDADSVNLNFDGVNGRDEIQTARSDQRMLVSKRSFSMKPLHEVKATKIVKVKHKKDGDDSDISGDSDERTKKIKIR